MDEMGRDRPGGKAVDGGIGGLWPKSTKIDKMAGICGNMSLRHISVTR